jgi:predicted membrane chloride channel (bestrophin family)
MKFQLVLSCCLITCSSAFVQTLLAPSGSLITHPLSSRHGLEGDGAPSHPGWQGSTRIERLSEWADSQKANRPIICEYHPSGFWLWKRWKGTVLKLIFRSVVASMATAAAVDVLARTVSTTTWGLLSVPPSTDPLISSLAGLEKLWAYHLTLCSFIITFFTSQAFEYWQRVYNTTRAIQGRINDFCMLLTISAERWQEEKDESTYTPTSLELVNKCNRLIRLCHTLFWASTPTASNGLTDDVEFQQEAESCPIPIDDDNIGPLLLSPYGLKVLQESKQLTAKEADTLLKSRLPCFQYPWILLEWVGIHCMKGLQKGILVGGTGLETNLLEQLTKLRGSMFDIADLRAGRMPLAYVQLVQVLVDSLILLAPFALYSQVGSLSIPLVGLLSLFFRGLLALSKSFLDPFGVEGNLDQTIRVDVLVSELNFGASMRWRLAGMNVPEEGDDDDETISSSKP